MDANLKSAAEGRLEASMTSTGVTFTTTAAVGNNSSKLEPNQTIRIAANTEPEADQYQSRGFFKYATFVNGKPSTLSKHTLFDGIQWAPVGDRELKQTEVTYNAGEKKGQKETLKIALVPWRELRKRNLNPMANAVEMLSVLLRDVNDPTKKVRSNVPMFVGEVELTTTVTKALVPVFGLESVIIDGVKHAQCELVEDYIYLE